MDNNLLPPSLNRLIQAFHQLPGVGPRTAERYAYYFVKSNSEQAIELAEALSELQAGIDLCQVTNALIPKGTNLSKLYSDPSRDKTIVAVVAEPFDILAIENTGQYKGTYHVLGGLLSPIDGLGPNELHIPQLIKRLKNDHVKELILATNASVEGESTAIYLQKQLENFDLVISRLARGIPVGVDLEYADQISLSRAIEHRQRFN